MASQKTQSKSAKVKPGSKLASTVKKAFVHMAKSSLPSSAKKPHPPSKSSGASMKSAHSAPKKSHPPAPKSAAKAGAVHEKTPPSGKKGSPKSAEAKAAAAHREKQTAIGKALANAKASKTGAPAPRTVVDVAGESVCREVACDGLATSAGYCRLHYIKNWKKIKRKELILKEGKLNQYIEELVTKYPDKYIEAIRQDLASDKDFAKVIYDLDLDEGVDDFEVEGESADSVLDTIKREFEDEGEGPY